MASPSAHSDLLLVPARLAGRGARSWHQRSDDLEELAARIDLTATGRGISQVALGSGDDDAALGGRGHARRARRELAEYLAGSRTFFSVPLDLRGLGAFQARVLAVTRRIPFGARASYAWLAGQLAHPRAARAVGNALAANPVPLLVPCHRVVRGDGTWGRYALGARFKTRLLALEGRTPALVGCTSTRVVCRLGCRREQRLREARRVVFASIGAARAMGYRRCRACRPC